MKYVIGLIAFFVPLVLFAQTDYSSLEERMSGEEFKRAGLEKLSEAELNYLNQWLRTQLSLPEPTVTQGTTNDDNVGFITKSVRRTIESRIDGTFTGWTGKTRFKLENGQVWQQISGGTYSRNAERPEVRIEPKSLGSWKLYVEGTNRSVKVKRIK